MNFETGPFLAARPALMSSGRFVWRLAFIAGTRNRAARKIEPRLQVVHAGLEKTVAVQRTPEPNGPQPRGRRKSLRGEVDRRFLRHEIHVGKHDDPRVRLLENLRAPPGLRSGIVALAFF